MIEFRILKTLKTYHSGTSEFSFFVPSYEMRLQYREDSQEFWITIPIITENHTHSHGHDHIATTSVKEHYVWKGPDS